MDDNKNKSDLPELPKPRSKDLGEDENKWDKRINAFFVSIFLLIAIGVGVFIYFILGLGRAF